jgi:hypothetical protein
MPKSDLINIYEVYRVAKNNLINEDTNKPVSPHPDLPSEGPGGVIELQPDRRHPQPPKDENAEGNKIWVLLGGNDYEGRNVMAVYTDGNKAKATYARLQKEGYGDNEDFYLEEYNANEEMFDLDNRDEDENSESQTHPAPNSAPAAQPKYDTMTAQVVGKKSYDELQR